MNSEEIKENIKERLKYCQTSKFDLLGEALTLINELESENKSLQDLCNKTYEDLTKEIDRLEKVGKHYQELIEDGKLISSEQLKQFAERLKIESVNKIHETLKEFLGK